MQESNKGARRLRNQVPKISQIYVLCLKENHVIKIIYFSTAESKCNKSNKIKLKTSLKLHTQYSKGNIQKEQLNISCGKYLKNIFYENFEKFKLQLNFNTIKKRLMKKTSNTDCAALKRIAYIAQSVMATNIGCQLFRSGYPMQPIGQARCATIGYLVYSPIK